MAKKVGKRAVRRPRFGRRRRGYEPERRLIQSNLALDKRLKLPLPQRYKTTLQLNIQGIVPPAGVSANGFALWQISGNSLHTPVNNSTFTTAGKFTLASGGGALTLATIAPAGYGDLMGAAGTKLYTYTRVLASKIVVTAVPQVASDTFSMVVVPTLPSGGFNSVLSAGSAPFSVGPKMCWPTNASDGNTLKAYISSAMFFGAPPSAVLIEDEYSASYAANPVNLFDWMILIQTADNAVTTNNISFDIRVKYYVEFFTSTEAGLKDTE